MTTSKGPIGVFDSGYGGLSVLRALHARLPQQPFLYLGDHRNMPYGSRTREELYDLTTDSIDWLFQRDCRLVILACNTASSVLRRIQREWLPRLYPDNRVLGIIVPTVEMVTGVAWNLPAAGSGGAPVTVGVFATIATVRSDVYPLEIHKRAPHMRVTQQACPDLTSLIESGAPRATIERTVEGYVAEMRAQLNGKLPDHALLGCTHYALIEDIFRAALGPDVPLINQPDCVAASFADYLDRHPRFRGETKKPPLLFTTGAADKVNKNGAAFLSNGLKFAAADFDPLG